MVFSSEGRPLTFSEYESMMLIAHLLSQRSPFFGKGLCGLLDDESKKAFFPRQGGSGKKAKGICLKCDYVFECFKFAYERNEPDGVWGASTPKERKEFKRRGISAKEAFVEIKQSLNEPNREGI
jgi:hypothetical protein